MTWTVAWSDVVERDVLRIHWRAASRACAAVVAFAERGEGTLEPTDSGGVYRLRVTGAVAVVRLDHVQAAVKSSPSRRCSLPSP